MYKQFASTPSHFNWKTLVGKQVRVELTNSEQLQGRVRQFFTGWLVLEVTPVTYVSVYQIVTFSVLD